MKLFCSVAKGRPVRFVLFFIALGLPLTAVAQSVSITSPTSLRVVKEGDDFATNALHDPWDMRERRDIGWEEGFNDKSIIITPSRRWRGKSNAPGAYVFPLFPGFKGALAAEGLPGDRTLPRLGINHTINASKYRLLSYKLKTNSRSALAIYWSKDRNAVNYWPDGSQFAAVYDGIFHGAHGYPHSGFNIYSFDMRKLSANFAQYAGSWSDRIHALRLDPSIGAPAGTTTEIEWIRLSDPRSAPTHTIKWSSDGISSSDIIVVYHDKNRSDFNGTPMKFFTGGSNPGQYTFPTSMLPPGTHYFYVGVLADNSLSMKARSGYSGALRIDAAPVVNFVAPTALSGTDYATAALGNPWDMTDASDVPNLDRAAWPDVWRQFSNEHFSGGRFVATANPPLYHLGNVETDAQVHLNVGPTGIDTSKYRYLTYRMRISTANYGNLSHRVANGWVTRAAFWNNEILADSGLPSAHVTYEGWHTYTVDLWNNAILEGGYPWRSFPRLHHLRLDPLETTVPTEFAIDWVKLTQENKTSRKKFEIVWTTTDDSSKANVSIWRDTNRRGYNGTKIVTLKDVPRGTHSYVWNASGLPKGKRYYIYLYINDGRNVRRFYAPTSIEIR